MKKYPDASVLIVDDEQDVLDLFSEYLAEIPGVIDTAQNGKRALELVRSKHYDCIVSDIAMPEMNGLELLESVRLEKKTTPFIIVTAYWDKSNAIRALRAGAFDFIEKPARLATLQTVVSSAIEVGVGLRSLDSNVKKIFDGFEKMSAEAESKMLQHQAFSHRSSGGITKK